jgi:hypothetical protein
MFERFIRWVFGGGQKQLDRPPIHYDVTSVAETAPPLESVLDGVVHVVAPNESPMWAMLRCPCGCTAVITLSLQRVHRPHWTVGISAEGRASLRPSVWRDVGCRSHFWVLDGRVYWA